MLSVGSTGTRYGMTAAQLAAFDVVILGLGPSEFHGGDCVGSDEQMMARVAALIPACTLTCHPPVDTAHRAWWNGYHVTHPPLTHFARNRNIVIASTVLVATPQQAEDPGFGGTWYTYNFARKKQKRVILIQPDGVVRDSGA